MPDVGVNEFFTASKAYLIGVADYQAPLSNLSSPKGDVALLAGVLEEEHDFDVDPPLINPDKRTLLSYIQSRNPGSNTRVVLYFACHGIAIDDDTKPKGYLLPADARPDKKDSFIEMSELLALIDQWSCKHLLLILDCCYAGAFRWSRRTRSLGEEVPKTIYYERFEQYAGHRAWQVLTSSAHDQEALDVLRLGKREIHQQDTNSPFARLLYTALKTGVADLSYGSTRPDGIITASELSFYLRQEIFTQLGQAGMDGDERQIPQLFPIPDMDKNNNGRGEFLFLNPAMIRLNRSVSLRHRTNDNPYKGFDSYAPGDSLLFYGRQRVLEGWETHIGLRQAIKERSLIIVTGPSGIGKSSLIRAGILSLYKDAADKAGMPVAYELRPGATPFSTHRGLLERLAADKERKILLVDQYEELVTICDDEQERQQFETLLERLSQHCILLTIRADLEDQFKGSPLFRIDSEKEKKIRLRYVVPAFSREEIREIVTLPAAQESLEFKSLSGMPDDNARFVDGIVDEAFQNPGSLPLLSLALNELYVRKDEYRNLLEVEYKKFGGISGILDKKATAEYDCYKQDAEGEEMFKWIIFRMISVEGGAIAKRRIYTSLKHTVDHDDLLFCEDQRTQKIKRIADRLETARLLRSDKDEQNRWYVEPAHEALLRSWGYVREWLRRQDDAGTEQSRLLLHQSVSTIALLYQDKVKEHDPKKARYLWKDDPRLGQVLKTISTRLNAVEVKFVNDSLQAKSLAKRLRNVVIGSVVLLVAAVVGVYYYQARKTLAQANKTKALSLLALSRSSEPTDAVGFLKEAHKLDPDNLDILSGIISASEFNRGVNKLVRKRLDFGDKLGYITMLNDSAFVTTTGEGVLWFNSPRQNRKVTLQGRPGFPMVFLSPEKKGVLAYNDGSPYLWEYNARGYLIDSMYIGTDTLADVDVLVDEGHIYALVNESVLCKNRGKVDTIGGQKFFSMCLYEGRGVLLGTRNGEVFFYDPDNRSLQRRYKAKAGVQQLVALPDKAVALVNFHGAIVILDSSFRPGPVFRSPVQNPEVAEIANVVAFRRSKKLLIKPAGSGRDSLILWDYGNGKKMYISQINFSGSVDVSPSERWIVSCATNQAMIHDTAGNVVFQYTTDADHDLSFIAFTGINDDFLATSYAGRVYFWRLDPTDLFRCTLDKSYDYPELGDIGNNLRTWDAVDGRYLDQLSHRIAGLSHIYGGLKFKASSALTHTASCLFTETGLAVIDRGGSTDSFRIGLEKGERLVVLDFVKTGDSLVGITNQGAVTVISVEHPQVRRAVINLHTYCIPQWHVFANRLFLMEIKNGNRFGLYDLNGNRTDLGKSPTNDWTSDKYCTKICYKSADKAISIRTLATGKTIVCELPGGNSTMPVLSPDGGFLLYRTMPAVDTDLVHLYSLKEDKLDQQLYQYKLGHRDERVQSLRFSLDGEQIVASFEHGVVENYLTPQGAKKWIDSVKCDSLPKEVRIKYDLK